MSERPTAADSVAGQPEYGPGAGLPAGPETPLAAPEVSPTPPRTLGRAASRRVAGAVDDTIGSAGVIRRELRHIFPDHWSFFLGEIALYCFIILVVTGVLLAFWFRPSAADVVYVGRYHPMHGVLMSDAYASTLDISFDIEGGLLVRQVHHWAALVFAGAVLLHLLRMFFTGAYRRPRRLNWVVGTTLLLLVMANGVFGYSLPDDLLSGTGLRIAYSITESIPLIGPWLASVMFGGPFPNGVLISRIYGLHIFIVPALIAGLLGLHLGMLWVQRHTQFPGRGKDERTVVGTPLVPAYALRTLGYLLLVGGVLTAMGAFLEINPVWLYGPYSAADATTMAQPDWYTTWLEGALRLFPNWDIHIGWFMLPALFWPAVVMPGVLFTVVYLWPWIDGFVTRDRRFHNLLTPPADRAGRGAIGAAVFTALAVLLFGGGSDVWAVALHADVHTLVHVVQGQLLALPFVAALLIYVVFQARAQRRREAGGPGGTARGGGATTWRPS